MRIEKYYEGYCFKFDEVREILIELDIEPYDSDIPDNYKIMQYECLSESYCNTCSVLRNFRKNFYSNP